MSRKNLNQTLFTALTLITGVSYLSPAFATNPSSVISNVVVDPGSGGSAYPGTSITARPGDIMVSDSTSSYGLTGHAGIVIDYNGTVVSIAGKGYHPQKYTMSTWWGLYPDEKIVRHSSASTAQSAATWASNFVTNYSSISYSISNLASPYTSTYCSKIVWDSYYYGANYTLPYYYDETFAYNLCAPYSLVGAPSTTTIFANF